MQRKNSINLISGGIDSIVNYSGNEGTSMPLGITSTPLHTSSVAAGSTTATKFENQSSVAAKKPLETKVKQGDQGSML